MLREAFQFLTDLSNGAVLNAHGRSYTRHELKKIESPLSLAEHLELHSLSGLVAYIKSNHDSILTGGKDEMLVEPAIHVGGPEGVSLIGALDGPFRQREVLATAEPFKSPGFRFGVYQDVETFVTALQSCFVQDEQTARVLQVVGNLSSEAVQTIVDDGVSQRAVARVGIAKVENVTVPNPVVLRPFRTFQEVEQPSSKFVLRLQRGGEGKLPTAALFEVADNQWQVAAINSIGAYLEAALEAEHIKAAVFA